MKRVRTCLCVFISALALLLLSSTDRAWSSDARFHSLNAMFGTTAKEVYSICKDEEGFIWAASKTGILRVSDNDLRLYDLSFTTSDRYLIRLVRRDSQLLAYADNGHIFRYNRLYDRFDLYVDIRKALNDPFINATGLVVDGNGTVWIGSTNGLYRCEEQELTPVGGTGGAVSQIAARDDGSLIVATTTGIGIFDTRSGTFEYIHRHSSPGVMQVSSMMYDPDLDGIWIGTISGGLLLFSVKESELREIARDDLPKQPILAIAKRRDSSVLVGIDGQGLFELSADGSTVLNIYREDENDPSSLPGNGVYDVFCDDNDVVWVATYTGGLSLFETGPSDVELIAHKINDPNSLANNNVNKVMEDSRGNIWFATNNGLSCRRSPSNRWHSYLGDHQDGARVFLALCEDDEGNIWAGSYSSGVYVINGETGRLVNHFFGESTTDEYSGQFIADMTKDAEGNIWMGGTRNLICWLKGEKKFRMYGEHSMNSISELSERTMLLACSYGLITLDKETGETRELLNNCRAQDAVLVGDDIWIATSGEGLLRYNRKSGPVQKYSTETGILSTYINSIAHADGYLWLGTEAGLCRFDIENETALAIPAAAYPRESYSANACSHLANGNIIWGTNRGAVVTDIDAIGEDSLDGRIFIHDIIISGRSIREYDDVLKGIPVNRQEKIVLNHKLNNLSVELFPVGTYTRDTKFAWKMSGLDPDWSRPSDLKFAIYNGLPGGEYRLDIRMYNSSLSRILHERSLVIEILPPYWETWWFRLLVVLAALGALFAVGRIYLNSLKQKHNREKMAFFTGMSHDLRTALTLVRAPIEKLSNSPDLPDGLKYYSDMAVRQSDWLSSVATQLLDFEKADSGRGQTFPVMTDVVRLLSERVEAFGESCREKEIEICFSPAPSSYVTAVDEMQIGKIADNLLSNAIKYTHVGGKIDVFFEGTPRFWSFEVKDYGFGISKEAQKQLFREFYRGDNPVNSKIVGSGIGLMLVKSYVDMHGGRILLDSKENVGSSFRVTIPYRKIESASEVRETQEVLPSPDAVQSAPEEGGSAASRKTHIVVVDDNEQMRDFLRTILSEQYHVSVASDGHQAWELIGKTMPHLIISDIVMPGVDGFELCRLVKSTFQTSHIPVVLLTSLSDKTKQTEGFGMGADDYITKPFDVTLLTLRVASILKNRDIVRERVLKVLNAADDGESIYANELNDMFVKNALAVVRDNISNSEFGKEEFASAMNVSSSLLYQKLKALTGQSPTELIKSIRFNYALELLRSRKYSISEVSEMCGFSSPNYFSTAFKQYFGVVPGKYRF